MMKELDKIDLMYQDQNSLWMQFRRFLGIYTKTVNKKYQRSGHLFAGKYSRINFSKDSYFFQLIAYIHQNPQSHGIVADYKIWPYSSYYAFVKRDRRSLLARRLFSDDELYNTIIDMHHNQVYGSDLIRL